MSRVMVVRLDGAGDVLLAGPAVRAVAHGRRPDGGAPNDVVMLCGPDGEQAASLLPGLSEVFSWSCPWIVKPAPRVEKRHLETLTSFVRNSRIAEAVILTSFHQSPLPLALLLRLAGVGRITGASVDYAGSLLDVRLRPGEDFPEDQPEAERALGIAQAAGFSLPPGIPASSGCRTIPMSATWSERNRTSWSTPEPPPPPGPGRRCTTQRQWNCSKEQVTAWW